MIKILQAVLIVGLLSLISPQAQAEDVQKVYAGIIASFKKEFVDEYKNTLNQKFIEQFTRMNFPTVENHYQFSIFDIYYQVSNIKVHETTYNPSKTEISMHKKKPNMLFRIVDCSFQFAFDYHIKTTPELLEDIGVGKAFLRDLNITIRANPYMYDRFVQFDFEEISVDIQDFGLDMVGGDISIIMNYFSETFKAFIRQYLLGQMGAQTRDALQGVINDLLLTVPRGIQLDGGQLEVDYGLVNEGIVVTDNYFSVLLDGTFHVANETDLETAKKTYTLMPVHVPQAEEIQLMISEYSLNRIVESVVKLDILEYENQEQTSDNVDAIISEFEEVFGEHPNVTITIKAQRDTLKYPPFIKISHAGSLIEFYVDIHIRNPLDTSIDAALMVAKTRANITFSVDNDFKLFGEINAMNMDVVEFYPYFKSQTSRQSINSRLSIFTPLMESYANNMLDNGWQLPVPRDITKYILKEKVTAYDGFLLIDGDADFTQDLENLLLNGETVTIKKNLRRLQSTDSSKQRFYHLVEKVYLHKLSTSQLTRNNYDDVFLAVNDIMQDYNTGDKSVAQNWTADLQAEHKQVTDDFKSGVLQWKDVSLPRIREIGNQIVDNIVNEISDEFKKIKASIFQEASNDLGLIKTIAQNADEEFDKIAKSIFRSIGGN